MRIRNLTKFYSQSSSDDLQSTLVINYSSVSLTLAFITFLIGVYLVTTGEYSQSFDLFGVLVIQLFSFIIYKQYKNLRLSSHVFIFSLAVGVSHNIYNFGFQNYTVFLLIIISLLTCYILNRKLSLYWNAYLFFLAVYAHFLREHVPANSLISKVDNTTFFCFIFVIITNLFIFQKIHQYKQNHKRATTQQQKQLATALLELQATQHTLNEKLTENSNLVKVLVHDIANPVSVLLVTLHSMSRISKDDFDTNFPLQLQKLNRATQTVVSILKHTREIEAVASGKKQIKLSPVFVDKAIEQARFIFKSQMDLKNIRLNYINPFNIDVSVLAEPVSFSNQILNNIISNAIKFSKENSEILITINRKEIYYVLEITDTGIGIPKDLIANLFSADKPTNRKGTHGEEGSGFGMPLMKYYLDLYNAKIEIDSKTIEESPNQHGTTFRIYFQIPNQDKQAHSVA